MIILSIGLDFYIELSINIYIYTHAHMLQLLELAYDHEILWDEVNQNTEFWDSNVRLFSKHSSKISSVLSLTFLCARMHLVHVGISLIFSF